MEVRTTDVPQIVNDMADWIKSTPFTEEQVKTLYFAITGRMRSSVCYRCTKLKPQIAGILTYPDGDLSKPKRFVCGDCK